MPEDYAVRVVRVIDGDSVKVRLPDGGEYSVRMYGIDAPEKSQRGGGEATRHLEDIVDGREWRLRVMDIDKYERLVGVLYPEGGKLNDSANHKLVESGRAYWYRDYGGEELGFDRSERKAKRWRRGVWSDLRAERPWDYRKKQRAKRSGESIWVRLTKAVLGGVGLAMWWIVKHLALFVWTLMFGERGRR